MSPEGMILVASSCIGSLFPDIDHRGSYIGKKAKVTSWFFSKLGHRGITHAPLVTFATLLPLYFLLHYNFPNPLLLPFMAGFLVGVLSHIVLDAFTKGGIPFFYPFTKEKYSLFHMKSGAVGESVVRGGLIVGTILLLAPNAWARLGENTVAFIQNMMG